MGGYACNFSGFGGVKVKTIEKNGITLRIGDFAKILSVKFTKDKDLIGAICRIKSVDLNPASEYRFVSISVDRLNNSNVEERNIGSWLIEIEEGDRLILVCKECLTDSCPTLRTK